MADQPLIWLLLGSRRGDNNQMLALAEGLGFPFEAKKLSYNALRHFPPLRRGLLHLDRKARRLISPPWPDLIIGVGPNSIAIAREIRRQSGGRSRLVHIGNPRGSIADIDLLISTPQFAPREGPNVLFLPFPIGNPARTVTPSDEEEQWLERFPRPRRLVAVGGATRKWKLDNDALEGAVCQLQAKSKRDGGSVIAVTSPRTSAATRQLLERLLRGDGFAVVGDSPRFATLLAACDEVYVTADSVSMLSEAILTGKPVGMIPISRTRRGQLARLGRWIGLPYRADLTDFWRFLTANNLVGSIATPVASRTADTVPIAVEAVRDVLKRPAQ